MTLGDVTLDEIGKQMGVTRERIRQIEHSAMRKLGIAMKLAERMSRADWERTLQRLDGKPLRHWEAVGVRHGVVLKKSSRAVNDDDARILEALASGRKSAQELAGVLDMHAKRPRLAHAVWRLRKQGKIYCVKRGVYELAEGA